MVEALALSRSKFIEVPEGDEISADWKYGGLGIEAGASSRDQLDAPALTPGFKPGSVGVWRSSDAGQNEHGPRSAAGCSPLNSRLRIIGCIRDGAWRDFGTTG